MAKRVRLPKAERESFRRRQINDCAQGGQTISGFCRERGLTESAFHLWKRQLGLKISHRHTGSKKSHSSARGATAEHLVGGSPGSSPVLVAIAGRTNAALPRS